MPEVLQSFSIQNFDLFLVGVTAAAIGILGFIVFLNNRQSITNKTFLIFSVTGIFYTIINYMSYQITDSPQTSLWFLRLTIFFAVWFSFCIFRLFYVFPKEKIETPKIHTFLVLPITVFTSLLTFTPFVFKEVAALSSEGRITQITNGPGIFLFGIVVISLVTGGLFSLLKKIRIVSQIEKTQFRYILVGSFISFFSLIIFNYVFPALLENARFVPLAPAFFLPLVIATGYSIMKYHLLNIKIIATEILTFVLAVTSLIEVVISHDIGTLILRLSTFVLVLIFSLLLIRSVQKEIEQREKLEVLSERLEELDRSKSEFVSIASHQLRTPLTAMKGYISMILEGSYGLLDTKQKKPVESIYEASERLIRLVNDLLNVSRIESGKVEMKWEQGSVEEIIKSVIQELAIKTRERNVELVFEEPESSLPLIRIDKEKIRNVLLNVVDNAIRYTPHGKITLSALVQQQNVRIRIQDTGEGMTKEEIGKLFETFSRGGAGMKFSTEGAGLGLYIAKKFVEMHKGKIWTESAGKGQGSTFFVELPIGVLN